MEDKKKEREEQQTVVIEEMITVTPLSEDRILLDEKIGSMLMVGFMGTRVDKNSQICKDISKYNLAGVILFDVNPVNHREPKNIVSKEQVRILTEELQSCSRDGKLLIAVDQEGGKVQRLKRKYGFYGKFPSAKTVRKRDEERIREEYYKMGEELSSGPGFNYNFKHPVVEPPL